MKVPFKLLPLDDALGSKRLLKIHLVDRILISWTIFHWQAKPIKSIQTDRQLFDVGNLYCNFFVRLDIPNVYRHEVLCLLVYCSQCCLLSLLGSLVVLLLGFLSFLDPPFHPFAGKGRRELMETDVWRYRKFVGDLQKLLGKIFVLLNKSDF